MHFGPAGIYALEFLLPSFGLVTTFHQREFATVTVVQYKV